VDQADALDHALVVVVAAEAVELAVAGVGAVLHHAERQRRAREGVADRATGALVVGVRVADLRADERVDQRQQVDIGRLRGLGRRMRRGGRVFMASSCTATTAAARHQQRGEPSRPQGEASPRR